MKRSATAPPQSPGSSSSCIHFKKPTKRPSSSSKKNAPTKPSSDTSARSSIYRGVTRHRWTGRFEAHLWDKSTWNNLHNKKGRQIYLGAYDNEEAAARTYDLAALKYWGPSTILNFPIERYKEEIEEMEKLSKEEYLASLRRRSSGFSRGVSKYRGVARHHQNGRWEARIGRVLGKKYLYLGTYSTQEEAATAYDLAAIEYRGLNAVTNFDMSKYADRLKSSGSGSPLSTIDDQKSPTVEHQTLSLEELSSAAAYSSIDELPTPTSPLAVREYIQEPPVDWMLSLDTLPDIPLEKPDSDVLDLFDVDTGFFQFDDNIDLLFDAPPSSPLSSSSTTTSVSSFIRG